MSFVHAGLVGLAGLLAIPLIIHLLNRRRYRRVPWAAMDFLLKAFQQNRRRLRLESLLLLLLRCAIPVLLALAVARPRLESGLVLDPTSRRGPHHVFVLDRSYSMGYREANGSRPFDRMKQVVGMLVDQISSRKNEKVSLVYMGGDVSTPLSGSLDPAKAQKALTRLEAPSDGRADLVAGLEAATKLAAAESEPARVYVFSDFQTLTVETDPSNATPPDKKDAAQPETSREFRAVRDLCDDLEHAGADVLFFPVAPRGATSNTQIVSTRLEPENAIARVPVTFRAEIVHRGPEKKEVLARVKVDGGNEQTRRIRLDPGETGEAVFQVRFLEEGPHAVEVAIEEDALPVDDRRRHVTRVRDRIRVLLVEGRETSDKEEILQNSFLYRYLLDPTQGEGGDELTTFETSVIDEDRFQTDSSFMRNQDLIALLDVTAPRPAVAKRLADFVERGGGLLIAPGQNSIADQYNALLFGAGGEGGPMPLRLLEIGGFKGFLGTGAGAAAPASYSTPKIVDEAHPVLADFKTPELRSVLEMTPVYRYWVTSRRDMPKDTRICADLAGSNALDLPALIATRRFGRGECLLLTSNPTLRPDRWNRLDDLDAIRFPLVHSMCHWLAREPKDSLNRLVGETLTTWLAQEPAALYMFRPGDGGRVALGKAKRAPARAAGQAGWDTPPFEDTVKAGLYRLGVEYADKTHAAGEVLFSVNPDPREGVLDYVSADRLAREIPSIEVREDLEVDVAAATETSTTEIGRLILLLALIAGLGEAVLASLLGGRRG